MNAERLLKLAEHLETGNLGHDAFDFTNYHFVDRCGTMGCAIGECPTIWPEYWEIRMGAVRLRTVYTGYASDHSQEWFALTNDQDDHLFVPGLQQTEVYGGCCLDDSATKEEVAANIRAFVERMK